MKPDSSYRDLLFDLMSLYRENKPLLFEMIKRFDSPVSVLSECYLILVHSKEITRLEDLPEEKKIEIWGGSENAEATDKTRSSIVHTSNYLICL